MFAGSSWRRLCCGQGSCLWTWACAGFGGGGLQRLEAGLASVALNGPGDAVVEGLGVGGQPTAAVLGVASVPEVERVLGVAGGAEAFFQKQKRAKAQRKIGQI